MVKCRSPYWCVMRCTQGCTHICLQAHTCTCTHIHRHTDTHPQTHMHTKTDTTRHHPHTHPHTHTHTHAHTHTPFGLLEEHMSKCFVSVLCAVLTHSGKQAYFEPLKKKNSLSLAPRASLHQLCIT